MRSGRLRVLVVEDSLTARRRICEVLSSSPEMEVVGETGDGRGAIDLCRELRPDAITMDMMLPIMSGLAATEFIMAHFPTPVLIVSSSTNRGELFKTYDALAAGAVDVLEKPRGDEPEGAWERRLIGAVRMVARIPVITHPRARLGGWAVAAATGSGAPPGIGHRSRARCELVALGASTGGPGAIVEVLRGLPERFPLPVLIVLHVGAPFASAFAEWLDGQTARPVDHAREGEPVSGLAGRVAMAPPDRHLVVKGGRLRLVDGPERHSCRPSVDALFESVAEDCGPAAAACLLTGIGRDGAEGLLRVRTAGGLTIAQDEATSVVYGMPREAARLGAAELVLPLGEIGPTLAALATPGEGARP